MDDVGKVMPLLESPLHIFSRSTFEQGQVRLKLAMPWSLPWGIAALRTALAWELAGACEQHQQLIPRQTGKALNDLKNLEAEIRNYNWLDETFSRNADRILAQIAEDVERVQPRPIVEIIGPTLDSESHEALDKLGKYLNLIVSYTSKPLPESTTPKAKAALCLLGSAGLVNAELGHMLIEGAVEAGDAAFAVALSNFVGGEWEGTRVFSVYDIAPSYEHLAPLLGVLGRITWPNIIPDWQDLDLPYLLTDLWTNPHNTLDRLRYDIGRQGKTSRNAFRVRLNIARHFLKCFLGDHGLAVRLDLLDASTALLSNQPMRAWELLSPYTKNTNLLNDAALSAHVYGHAGQAAARLDRAQDAFVLYEKNLACLGQAFGLDTNQYKNALAGLHHKLGQLLREHPELPGGFAQAHRHLEQSLELHKTLKRPGGVSMCLNELGKLSMEEGNFEKGKVWFEEALELDRKNQNALGESRILHDLAILHERNGEFSQALSYVEQCEQVQQTAGIGGNLRQRLLNTRERLRDMLSIENEGESETPTDILNRISSDEPRTFSTHVSQKSRTLRQEGRYADAEELLRKALEYLIPEAHRQFLWHALAKLLLDLRRHDEAREILQNLLPQSDRTRDEIVLLKARLESQAGNYDEAEAIITSIEAPSQPEVISRVHFMRGQIIFQQNRFTEAASEFRAAQENSQSSLYAARLAMEKEARALLAAGEHQQAVSLAKQLANTTATGKWKLRQVRAAMILGEALMQLGQVREAADEFERALALVRDSEHTSGFPLIALERGAAQAWYRAGNTHAALTHIQIAQELLEQQDAPLEQRGSVYILAAYLHRVSGSSAEFESALRTAEQYAQSADSKRLQQAVVILRQGDLRQDDWAMDDFDWDEDDTPQAAIGRARRLRARWKIDEALKTLAPFEQAAITEPVRREMLELKLGLLLDLHERGGEVDLAEILETLISGRPDSELSPKLLLLRARAEILERKYETAIDTGMLAYQKAREMREFISIARAGSLLSKAFGEIGQLSKATAILQQIADYMRAQGRQQFAFDARYSLSRHLINIRKFDEARQQLQELTDQSSQLNLADWVRLQIAHAEIERIEVKPEASLRRLDEVIARVETQNRPELKAEAERLRRAILLDSGQIQNLLAYPLDSSPSSLRATKNIVGSIKSLQQSGRHKEAIALAEQLLEKEGSTISRTRAVVLHQAAKSYFKGKDFKRAEVICRHSLELHMSLGVKSGTPGVRVTLADILAVTGRAEEAQQQLLLGLHENQEMRDERGVQICQRRLEQFSGSTSNIGRSLMAHDLLNHAQTLRHREEYAESIKLVSEALGQARAEGDEWTASAGTWSPWYQ